MTYGVLFAGWPPIQLDFRVIVSLVLLATSPAEVPATMRRPSHWSAVQPAPLTFRVLAPYSALEPEASMLTGSRSTGLAGAVLRMVVVRLSLLFVASHATLLRSMSEASLSFFIKSCSEVNVGLPAWAGSVTPGWKPGWPGAGTVFAARNDFSASLTLMASASVPFMNGRS